jgi:hypothetical protein
MSISLPHCPATRGRVVIFIGLAFVVSACTRSPIAPDALAPVPHAASGSALASDPMALVTPNRVVTTFPLLNGSFTLTLRAADGSAGTIKGTYTGQAVASVPGNTNATLDLHISETTGLGSTITELQADGTGAFVGEGDFTLSLALASAATKSPGPSRATFKGTSRLSCSAASHLIVVTQHGTDSTPKFLQVTIDLQHEVGPTACVG